ncbi:MAG: zf-HC2 domain-containing protein [Nitrososphaerota archaeon]
MTLSTPAHKWLRRISDYHSGGVSEAERAAVEAHLATCQECQEALAMYRRFYSLLRSPLWLGSPGVHFDEDTLISDAATPSPARFQPTQPPRRSRRARALAGIAAVVAATLVVAGFLAVYGTRGVQPTTAGTPSPRTTASVSATATAEATATPGASGTPQAGAFVCANPSGSNLTYAYLRGDHNLYIVTGCAKPQALPLPNFSAPLAWSPTNRYLAVRSCDVNGNCPLVIYDTRSGQTLTTNFVAEYPSEANVGQVIRFFIGWVDDNTFVGALQPVASNNADSPLGTSTIVKVSVATRAETPVGQVAWFAGTKMVAPGYLFYAGLKTMSEGQAYLHRLDLASGTDTRLVPLGEYGRGGCQMTNFCNWTAPWDVSPDGTHVIYHNPGPTSFPSDINFVKDTPLVYANIDGTNSTRPFGDNISDILTSASFSPDGSYLLATGLSRQQTPSAPPRSALLRLGGTPTYMDGAFFAWRGDSQAMILGVVNPSTSGVAGPLTPALYDLSSRATTPLEPDSSNYLWGY